MADIVVTARPFSIFSQTDYYDPPSGGSAAGPGVAMGQMVAEDLSTKDNVKVDPDAQSEEIVVTAQKIKNAIIGLGGGMSVAGYPNDAFSTTCAGPFSFNEAIANIKNIEFRLVTQDFGPGRAGANMVGSDGNNVPVLVNATDATSCANMPNGALYLVAHEIAHALTAMQTYNNQLWSDYVSHSDPNLTQAQLLQNYPSSPQFAANEARANSIANALVQTAGYGPIGFVPTHGYETC